MIEQHEGRRLKARENIAVKEYLEIREFEKDVRMKESLRGRIECCKHNWTIVSQRATREAKTEWNVGR